MRKKWLLDIGANIYITNDDADFKLGIIKDISKLPNRFLIIIRNSPIYLIKISIIIIILRGPIGERNRLVLINCYYMRKFLLKVIFRDRLYKARFKI
jgi:hypothetical protein